MKQTARERLDEQLAHIGLQAALSHPKAKLWAKVNCCDNFSLAIATTVEDAIISEVSLRLSREDIDWVNDMCDKHRGHSKLDKFVIGIFHKAYDKLTK